MKQHLTCKTLCHHREYQNHRRIFLAWFTVVLFRLGSGVRPACDIPPGDLLKSTTITCFFPGELGQSGFEVIHLSRNESVVIAKWDNDQYMYSLDNGFSMEGQQPTSHITFTLNWITRNHTGTYACVPDGNSYRNVGTCTLSLNSEKPKEPPVGSATIGNGSENDCERSRQGYIAATAALSIAFSIVVIILIVHGIYYYCKTRHECKTKKAKQKGTQRLFPDKNWHLAINEQEEKCHLDETECAPEISLELDGRKSLKCNGHQ